MISAFSLKVIILSPQIQGVVSGTGITKCVFNAQMVGLLILTKFAPLSAISAKLGIQRDYALLALKDMT
jgi:hypothetical protein